MAVKIRLARCGKNNSPFYRVVIQDRERARNGKFLEIVGTYNPKDRNDSNRFSLKKERVEYWLAKGAVPTETVAQLIKEI